MVEMTSLRQEPDGGFCRYTRAVEVPSDPHERDETLVAEVLTRDIFSSYEPCSGQARSGGAIEPGVVASEYWESFTLPSPHPYIAPGKAITGLAAFLETRSTLSFSHTTPDTVFGPLEIVATGSYYVDWGDGTRTGPHAVEGQPWPHGEIPHSYAHVGSYDVTVEIRWTATWRFGDQSGVLRELRTQGFIEDFPVGQIQAVVVG